MVSFSVFKHDYTKSLYKYSEPLSADYRVFVNGEEAPVYTCRISKYPFNRIWPGYQRSAAQTRVASFVNIVSDENVDIKVVPAETGDVIIKPYSRKISHTVKDGEILFTLEEKGQYILEQSDGEKVLYIFNSKPVECENPEEVTHYFGPGIHFAGKIVLNSNESVYVHKDALVFGCIFAEKAENIRVYGNGVFDDRSEGRVDNSCYEEFTNGNIKFYDCKNIRVEGVLFKDSAIWCVNVFHCEDMVFDNIKVFGQWRYNTDGMDIVNSRNITLKNSLIHSFDDTISIKGIDRYVHTNNENILVENCVLWCDWNNCCELGIETSCREYRNITFRNCDIVNAAHVALDISNGEYAEISDVSFENIRVEYNCFTRPNVYQKYEEMVYDKADEIAIPMLFRLQNTRWRTQEQHDNWNLCLDMPDMDFSGIEQGGIHHVKIKDIEVYYDEIIPKKDGKFHIPAYLKSDVPSVKLHNIEISDIRVNGESVGLDYIDIDMDDTVELI